MVCLGVPSLVLPGLHRHTAFLSTPWVPAHQAPYRLRRVEFKPVLVCGFAGSNLFSTLMRAAESWGSLSLDALAGAPRLQAAGAFRLQRGA